jgi:hypothetical protein
VSPSLRTACSLLLCASLLTACGSNPLTKLQLVDRKPDASLVQPCPPDPAVPPEVGADGKPMTDTEGAVYMLELKAALDACRARHASLVKWAVGSMPPAP